LAVALAGGALANVTDFGNPSSVNLLERWNPDGTYGVTTTVTCTYLNPDGTVKSKEVLTFIDGVWTILSYNADDDLLWTTPQAGMYISGGSLDRLQAYARGGNALRFGHGGKDDDRLIEIAYTFDSAITVDKLVAHFSGGDHSPTNYAWFADGAAIPSASVARPADPFDQDNYVRLTGYAYEHTLTTPVTGTTFTFQTFLEGRTWTGEPDLNWYHVAEMHVLGIYLAKDSGQSLAMDGTYNIFYQERNAPTMAWADPNREGEPGVPTGWTDLRNDNNGSKPSVHAGSATWAFENTYELQGMMLTQFDRGRHMQAPLLEASTDGVNWTTLWDNGGNNYVWDPDNALYIPFENAGILASYVRLSWGDHDGSNSGEVDITQFQLFGKAIPEPATMTLLALGGAALLRRRR